ncbi:MAG: MotA/TolQ/ExbB proton channel family protein [Acidobacteriota bacterium]
MRNHRGPDRATIAGAAIAVTGIVAGVGLEGLSLYDVAQPTAALVVFFGTAGAAMLSVPSSQIGHALRVFRKIFFDSPEDPRHLVARFLVWSRASRAKGVASLDGETGRIEDPVLRKGLRLVADAAGETGIRSVMALEVRGIETEAEAAAQFYETAAGYAPTLGIVGAAIGLIQVMKHLDHIDQVGSGIAAAFVATIYGVLLANLVLLPVATRIRTQCLHRIRTCHVITEGLLSLAGGLNPRLLRMNLETLLQVPETEEPAGRLTLPAPLAQKG